MRETIDIHQTRAAEDLFDLSAAVEIAQHASELELAVGAWGEVGVTAFRRNRQQASVDPMEVRLAEAGAGGDHRGVSCALRFASLQKQQLAVIEERHAVGHCLQIVEERNVRRIKMTIDLSDGDVPCDVREASLLTDDGPRHANRSGIDHKPAAGIAGERVEDGGEAVELLGRVRAGKNLSRAPLTALEQT